MTDPFQAGGSRSRPSDPPAPFSPSVGSDINFQEAEDAILAAFARAGTRATPEGESEERPGVLERARRRVFGDPVSNRGLTDLITGEGEGRQRHPVLAFAGRLLRDAITLRRLEHRGLAGVKESLALDVQDATQAGRATLRGLANFGIELAETAGELGATEARHTGLGEFLQPGFNLAFEAEGAKGIVEGVTAPLHRGVDKVFGPRSHSALINFVEGAVQFTTAFALTGPLKVTKAGPALAKIGGVAQLGVAALRGAAVDLTAFDPYEAQLAELVARIPFEPVRRVAEELSVTEDDGAVVARLKRAAAGVVPGVALDAIVWGFRWVRSARQALNANLPEAARAEALEVHATAEAQLEAIGNRTAADPGAAVVPVENPNGTGTLAINPTGPLARVRRRVAEFVDPSAVRDPVSGLFNKAQWQAARPRLEADKSLEFVFFDVKNLKAVNELVSFDAGSARIREVAEAVRGVARDAGISERLLFNPGGDEIIAAVPKGQGARLLASALEAVPEAPIGTSGHVSGLRGTVAESFAAADAKLSSAKAVEGGKFRTVEAAAREKLRTGEPAVPSDAPTFTNYAEAATQAEIINGNLRAAQAAVEGAGKLTDETVAAVRDMTRNLIRARDAGDVVPLLEGTHFNLSYFGAPDDGVATIEAVSRVMREEIDAAQRAGGVPVEKSMEMMRRYVASLPQDFAAGILTKDMADLADVHVRVLAANAVLKHQGREVAKVSDLLDRRPHDVVLHEQMRTQLDYFFGLHEATAGANSELGRALRILQERAHPKTEGLRFKAPKGAPEAKVTPKAPREKSYTAGMEHREIRALARMIRMADGDPRAAFAVAQAARVMQRRGGQRAIAAAVQVFTNAILSGLKTLQTVSGSGLMLGQFEAASRILGGVVTGDRQLTRFGADLMYGQWKYLGDGLRTAGMAFRSGHSIINPGMVDNSFGDVAGDFMVAVSKLFGADEAAEVKLRAAGGVTGQLVNVPGRMIGAADEMTRATLYRSYVRAQSLKIARGQGLSGPALARRVEEDVAHAFDSETGIALIPEALTFAERPTLSGPLAKDTFGGALQSFTNEAVAAKFVIPFVKASMKIWDYAWQTIPGLNRFNREARAIIKAGGPEAVALHAKSALATGIYAYFGYELLADRVTGRGPSDPELRKLWLKNHKPYSIKVGDAWYSYLRADPFATTIGVIADATTILRELEGEADGEDVAAAVVAGVISSLSHKTYLQGLLDFSEAVSSGDGPRTLRWLGGNVAAIGAPNVVAQFNPDPVLRDAQGVVEMWQARVPGLSDRLAPRYDAFGEAVMRDPGFVNRNLAVFPKRPAARTLEDVLLEDRVEIGSAPRRLFGGLLDLDDPQWGERNGKTAWRRYMELVRSGVDGLPGMRAWLTETVNSPAYQDASATTPFFRGKKQLIISARKQALEERAFAVLLEEFPKLSEAWRAYQGARGLTIQGEIPRSIRSFNELLKAAESLR